MRIAQILPGSGDRFYCENCVRDNALVRALIRAGHEVVVAPLYLPQLGERLEGVPDAPVFYGGINAYLQQQSAFFRKTPRWIDRLLDARFLLRMAAKKAGSVRARGLGEMTLSVLRGAEGNQAKELERLVRWMESMPRPDVVHLSSPLLLGIGREIRKRLGSPLVCTMQDEDVWIDAMEEPARSRCWEAMAEGAKDVEAFIAVSRYFGDLMRERLSIDPARLHVVHIGVEPGAPPAPRSGSPAIGYLARRSEGMGLGILADAFLRLRKSRPVLRLHVSGGSTDDDLPFLARLGEKFSSEGAAGDVQFFDEFDAASRRRFMEPLSVLSVPSPRGTAYGTYLLEAMAAGVPVVQPRLGSFPELVEASGGGVLYDPNDAETLARALDGLLSDPARAAELARRGREAVIDRFSCDRMAAATAEIYRGILAPRGEPAGRPS
jgi:glycosyltransferase involved in cell wall biosynthesis